MKFVKITSKKPVTIDGDYADANVLIRDGHITIGGETYPISDTKSIRQGFNFHNTVAYDDSMPADAPAAPAEPVPAPTQAEVPPMPAEPAKRPKFRMHKVAQPVSEPAPAPVETVPEPAPAPVEPASEGSENPTLDELIAQVKVLIEPVKPDFEGSIELPDGTLEIRYFKKKE